MHKQSYFNPMTKILKSLRHESYICDMVFCILIIIHFFVEQTTLKCFKLIGHCLFSFFTRDQELYLWRQFSFPFKRRFNFRRVIFYISANTLNYSTWNYVLKRGIISIRILQLKWLRSYFQFLPKNNCYHISNEVSLNSYIFM